MKSRFLLVVLAVVFSGSGFFCPAAFGQDGARARDAVVLFTGDVHCAVDQGYGYAGLTGLRDVFASAGDDVLLADCGDAVQGEPLGGETRGEAIVALMNAAGYSVAVPGNHEFDFGVPQFLKLAELADFPYVCCNFRHNGERVLKPYVIRELAGVKIAFVGIATPKTLGSVRSSYFKDADRNFVYDFMQDATGETLYRAVQDAVDAARAEGADYVVALAHLGVSEDCAPWRSVDVVANTTGIDAVLDGHSHDAAVVRLKNKEGRETVRCACGVKFSHIGWLRIGADGRLDAGLYDGIGADVPRMGLDLIKNGMAEKVAEAKAKLAQTLDEVVAKSRVNLTIFSPDPNDPAKRVRTVRRAETNMGDFCTDAFRFRTGADAAFLNGGTIRGDLAAGEITRGELKVAHPFGNKIVTVEATGRQILDALEWGAREWPAESGGFLQTSGLTYAIDPRVKSGCVKDAVGAFARVEGERRVKNVKIGGEPLDPDKSYKLACTDYVLLDEGDGFVMFRGCRILDRGESLDDCRAFLDYAAEELGGEIGERYANPRGEGRITVLQ